MTQPAQAPGWYPDPNRLPTLRWHDGIRWTEQVAPLTGTAHQPMHVRPEKKHWTQAEVPFTIKIIFVLVILFLAFWVVSNFA